jgi:hypothetical protein
MTFVRTGVSDKHSASIFKATRTGELGTTLAVSSNRLSLLVIANVVSSSPIFITLIMEALRSSETSVLTRTTRHNIQENGILQFSFIVTGYKVQYDRFVELLGWGDIAKFRTVRICKVDIIYLLAEMHKFVIILQPLRLKYLA